MINTVSFHWFSQHYTKMCSKCINKLSLAISLKFPEGATLATTLATTLAALAAIFVSEDMSEKFPHKEKNSLSDGENSPQNNAKGETMPPKRRKEVLHMEKKKHKRVKRLLKKKLLFYVPRRGRGERLLL